MTEHQSQKSGMVEVVVIALGILVVILYVGYAYLQYENYIVNYYLDHQRLHDTEPASIGTASALSNDEVYRAYFSLLDASGRPTAWDGTVNIKIKHDSDILYENTLTVKQSEFQKYNIESTGEEFFAYAWTFPASDVRSGYLKDFPTDFPTVTITFTTSLGKNLICEILYC